MRVPDRRLNRWREVIDETWQRHRKRMFFLYFAGFAAGIILGHFVLGWQGGSAVIFAFLVGYLGPLLGGLFIELPVARRLFRERTALCVHCGYDLRATPFRCPECGAVPTKPQNWN